MEPRHIQLLTDHVANKIAAGEVVDRPASVLKELVENALDAGATQIEVEVVAGGRTAIVVTDNGCGMGRDDVLLSVERHATSKIREVEDIDRIETLGFRGEALAAISSVSRFTLLSRPAALETGTELVMAGGRVLEVRDAGCPAGTSIAVRHLFHNVPARRRFMRSEQTELGHLRQAFLLYALSRPAVGWRLVVDEREVHRLPPVPSLQDRLRELFGPELMAGLRPLHFESPEVRLHGYCGVPSLNRGDRSEQYIFINGRPASAPVVGYAMSEAYHTLIPKGRHPVAFLFIELAPEDVDVNVHPTKREVRFRNGTPVRDALLAALRDALKIEALPAAPEAVPEFVRMGRSSPALTIPDLPSLPPFSYPKSGLAAPDPAFAPAPPAAAEPSTPSAASPPAGAPAAAGKADAPWSWCRVLGQVGGLYVIFETEDGMIVMDPHAAHERVLFERFMAQLKAHAVPGQGLLAPETVDLPPERAMAVRANIERLRDMGFGVADFGSDSFLVDALPVCLGNAAAREVLGEIAQTMEQGGTRGGTDRWAEDQIAMAACKAAVKANDRLTLQEIEGLVLELARAEMPYTCPHGRPTTIFMSFQDLRRKFGRA